MKKLFAILAIVVALAFAMTVNASDMSVDDKYLDRAVTLLSDLDIIEQTDDYLDPLSRGDFTVMLVKALGIGNLSSSEPLPFTDIEKGDSYYDAVQTAYGLGIISNGTEFEPSRDITYDEIVKMTVCAAGYSFLAENFGPYPVGYQVAASRLNMLDGIITADCTYAAAYVILYNTITTDLPEVSIIDGEINYSIDSGRNILESIYDLTLIEGRVDGAEYFGGVSGNGVGEGFTSIDGTLLKKGIFDTDSFYGQECSAWYDKSGTIKTIYVEEPAKNDVVILKSGDDDVSYSDLTYTYYTNNGKTKCTASVAYDSVIVYNGKKTVYSDSVMLPEHGVVKLVRTGSGKYDTVIIDDFAELVVGTINSEKIYITDIRGTQRIVSLDPVDYDNLKIYDQNGRAITFSDIKKCDIVWFAQSSDQRLMNVKVSKEYFAGEYTGDGDETEIYIDGERYYFSDSREKVIPSTIARGNIVTVYFNCDGKIAYIARDASGGDAKIAYLVASRIGEGLNSEIVIRMFTLEGKMREFPMAQKFSINGLSFKSTKSDYDKLLKDEANPNFMKTSIITYALNKQNQIVSINYPQDIALEFGGKKFDLFQNGYIDKYQGESIDQYIRFFEKQQEIVSRSGGRLYLDPYSISLMTVPRTSDFGKAENKHYKVKPFSDIASGTYFANYYLYGYAFDSDTMYSDVILGIYALTSDMGEVDATTESYMVSSVSQGLDDDGNEATVICVTNKIETLRLYSYGDTFIKDNNISTGDIVKIDYLGNELNGITLIYKAGNKTLSNKTNLGSTGCVLVDGDSVMTNNEGMASLAGSYNVLGRVYKRDKEVIVVLPLNVDINSDFDPSLLKSFSLSMVSKIFKYDSKTDQITEVYSDNIEDFLSCGNVCDTVVVEADGGYIESVFVFE